MPIFYHTAEKQCFQSLQCGAVHSRILSKTQGRAGRRLQHPKWYFQRFRALNTIRSTMCHGSGPSDYFAVYPYRPAKPRVPWIMHLALFSIMGFVLTTCTIAGELTCLSTKTHLIAVVLRRKGKVRYLNSTRLVVCIITMNAMRRELACRQSRSCAESPSAPSILRSLADKRHPF